MHPLLLYFRERTPGCWELWSWELYWVWYGTQCPYLNSALNANTVIGSDGSRYAQAGGPLLMGKGLCLNGLNAEYFFPIYSTVETVVMASQPCLKGTGSWELLISAHFNVNKQCRLSLKRK